MQQLIRRIVGYILNQYPTVLILCALMTTLSYLVLVYDLEDQEGNSTLIKLSSEQIQRVYSINFYLTELFEEHHLEYEQNLKRKISRELSLLQETHDSLKNGDRFIRDTKGLVRIHETLNDQLYSLYFSGQPSLDYLLKNYTITVRHLLNVQISFIQQQKELSTLYNKITPNLLVDLSRVSSFYQRRTESMLNNTRNLHLMILIFNLSGLLILGSGILRPLVHRLKDSTQKLEAEKKFANNVINTAQAFIIGLDTEAKIILFNNYAQKHTGWQTDEVIGQNFLEVFIPIQDQAALKQRFSEMMNNHITNTDEIESQLLTHSGEILDIVWHSTTISRGKKYSNELFLATGIDITERKQMARRDQAHNQVLELLYKGAALTDILIAIIQNVISEKSQTLASILLWDSDIKPLIIGVDFTLDSSVPVKIKPHFIYTHLTKNQLQNWIIDSHQINPILQYPEELPYKTELISKGYQAYWIEPIKSSTGALLGGLIFYYLSPIHNVANQKLIEQACNLINLAIERTQANQEQQLATLIYQNSSEAMVVVDANHQIITINPAFTHITGYNFEEVKGKNLKILSSGLQDNFFYREFWHSLNTKGSWRGEIWNRRKNGEIYVEWLVINSFFHADGSLHGRVALFSDITQRKQAEKALRELNETLEIRVKQRTDELLQSEKMAALGQLIAGIAHEINTPLGAISSSASNMRHFLNQTLTIMPSLFQSFSTQDSEDFFNLLNRALNNHDISLSAKEQRQYRRNLTQRLITELENADMVADTLIDMGLFNDIETLIPILKRHDGDKILQVAYQLSELKKGAQTIHIATERASKVVFALKAYTHHDTSGKRTQINIIEGIETVLTLYQSLLKQDIQLITDYESDLPYICGFADELNQVWTNLIHNAIQAMNNKGVLSIRVYKENEQYIIVSIEDNGKGIEPEYQNRIFEAFFTTKTTGEGSGLGLHIIKKIVEKHAGKITVNSQPGCTIFRVYLPLVYEEPQPSAWIYNL
ncbi:MAG: hypothetical protein RL637_1178 [Pseudomonadota bacterium]